MDLTRCCCTVHYLNINRTINLPHKQLIRLGRNRDTGCEDLHVSRNQIECEADWDKGIVTVRPIGRTTVGSNGRHLVRFQRYELKEGDSFEMRLGHHRCNISFAQKMTHNWESIEHDELLIYTNYSAPHLSTNRVAGFDLDGTIIRTKSGARFPKDCHDWCLNLSQIKTKFDALRAHSSIVIFTNQAGVGQDAVKISDYKRKIEKISDSLNSDNLTVMVATSKTIYRKPAPGMWDHLVRHKIRPGTMVDQENSFYCGDAAGRPKNWSFQRPKDHSCADRLFAFNLGLKFYTPEEYFLGAQPYTKFVLPEFDPRTVSHKGTLDQIPLEILVPSSPLIILMVGPPASGKTTYCNRELIPKGFHHVNRDKLGTQPKCLTYLESVLKANGSAVIDNMNQTRMMRAQYVRLAQKYGATCKCLVMETGLEHSKHNNRFRNTITGKLIPDLVYHQFKRDYEPPSVVEGFETITTIPFHAIFEHAQDERIYKMFLCDK